MSTATSDFNQPARCQHSRGARRWRPSGLNPVKCVINNYYSLHRGEALFSASGRSRFHCNEYIEFYFFFFFQYVGHVHTHARTDARAHTHTRRLSHCFWRPLCGWEQAAPALPSRLRRAVWPFTLAQQSRPVSVRALRGQLLPRTLASSAGPIMNIPPAMKVILSDTQLSGHIVSAALFAAFEGRPSQRPHRRCPLLLDLVTKSDCKMT